MWLRNVALFCALVAIGCRSSADVSVAVPSPGKPVFLTATGSIRALYAGPDGALWAATGGGVLCWRPGADAPRVWTATDGLPSSDTRAVFLTPDGIGVEDASGSCVIRLSGTISPMPSPENALVLHRNLQTVGEFQADALGLRRRVGAHWQDVPLPPGSPASHVSALCGDGRSGVLAALYGDGIYALTGTRWTRLGNAPPACRFAVALARLPDGGLAVGTSRDGVWRLSKNRWTALPAPPSLPDADIQTLAAFDGALWAGTLDRGLLRLDGDAVRAFTHADGLRADAPRGLLVFQNRLYVRHATGDLDAFDGKTWRPAFPKADLPRPQVYALATDGKRLLLGGWAGWAAWDGKNWERHYGEPELAGQVVTAIGADASGMVWIGTQKQGILRWTNGKYQSDHEAQGLTDDWITCVNLDGETPLVGTYTGGLLTRERDGRYAVTLRPKAFAIRAVAHLTNGQIAAATPLGVAVQQGKSWKYLDAGGPEAQTLLPAPGGLWIGTRTGLAFVPTETLTNWESASRSASAQSLPERH